MNDFKDKFLADIGARRLINNLAFTAINNYNYKHSSQSENTYNKIIVKGGKALQLIQGKPTESFDVDGDLFLSRDVMEEILPQNKTIISGTEIVPKLEEYTNPLKTQEDNVNQLYQIAQEISDEMNSRLKNGKNSYDNMIYRVQLDAIVSKYLTQYCLPAFVLYNPQGNCYDCKVIHKLDSRVIEVNAEGRRIQQQVWIIKFTLYFEFKPSYSKTPLEMNESKRLPNSLKIAFLDLTVANPYLQIENYKNRLDIELSPKFYILRPTLIINNLVDMASQPDFHKRNIAHQKYEQFIRLNFTDYDCEVISKLSPKNMQQEQELNTIAQQRAQLKNNPIAMAKTEEELYRKIVGINGNSNANINKDVEQYAQTKNINWEQLQPIEKVNLRKQFIHNKLKQLGAIGNLNKHIRTDVKQMTVQYSEVLAPFEKYLDIFTNAHANYTDEIKNARKKCEPYKVSDKYLHMKNVVNKSFISEEKKGILTKYIKQTTKCNFYPFWQYSFLQNSNQLQYFFMNKTENYSSPIVKFTSFSYCRFITKPFTTVSTANYPQPVTLDDLEINHEYYFNMNIPQEDEKPFLVPRDFLNQDGFLIIIYPAERKQNVHVEKVKEQRNGKEIEKTYKYFSSNIMLKVKLPSYINVQIDNEKVLDKINLLVFQEK